MTNIIFKVQREELTFSISTEEEAQEHYYWPDYKHHLTAWHQHALSASVTGLEATANLSNLKFQIKNFQSLKEEREKGV